MTKKELEDKPQTPLHERLFGKKYVHEVICSADRRKPI